MRVREFMEVSEGEKNDIDVYTERIGRDSNCLVKEENDWLEVEEEKKEEEN